MKNRRCTDFLFTILFFAFVGFLGWIISLGLNNGKVLDLLSPVDYDGKLCGVDYPDHPYLYFLVTIKSIDIQKQPPDA